MGLPCYLVAAMSRDGTGETMGLARLRRVIAAVLMTAAATPAVAEPWPVRDQARVLFFGNSLVHHLTDSDTTTVPHWLALMARHAGKSFAVDGVWGFPRQFSADLPPTGNWSFKEARPVTTGWGKLDATRYDLVILNTENYVHYRGPERRYEGDNPTGESPVSATLAVTDWVAAANPATPFWIYEGWPDMTPLVRGFPPRPRELARYHAFAQGEYHDWNRAFVAALNRERPGRDIRLIPVSRVMAELMTQPDLAALPVEAFYSDISPHGTATTYLLAAMVTYAAVYGERPPAGFTVPEGIEPVVAQGYEALADRIWAAMAPGAS